MQISATDFGHNFKWGVSTAAYQIEGAHDAHGKGLSIWDTFSQKRKKIVDNHNGNIACDFYNRCTEDILLLYKLNIPNYRFSISWSRIFRGRTPGPIPCRAHRQRDGRECSSP